MEDFEQNAVDNFLKEGYSCSESIVKAAIDEGLVPAEMLDVATPFSGGLSSGCLCGTIAGSQIVLGFKHGHTKTKLAREKAKQFIKEFKEKHKATCCAALTHKFEFDSVERKQNCSKLVRDCAQLLKKLL